MQFNIWAALLAAVSSFFLGGLWYSKALFGPAWGRAAGIDPEKMKAGQPHRHPARVFGVSFFFSLVAAFAFARLLGPNPELGHALRRGLVVGAAFVAASFGTTTSSPTAAPGCGSSTAATTPRSSSCSG